MSHTFKIKNLSACEILKYAACLNFPRKYVIKSFVEIFFFLIMVLILSFEEPFLRNELSKIFEDLLRMT